MDSPKPELQNTRIIRRTARFILLPFRLVGAAFVAIKRMIRRQTPEQVRAEEQQRQTRIRRELRGLPPDHMPPAVKQE